MIGLDTNVLVRYLVQDDAVQSAVAAELIEGLSPVEPGFVSLVTTVEIYWVLRRTYRQPAVEGLAVIAKLLAASELRLERADLLRSAVDDCRNGGDFADAVIAGLSRTAGCTHTVTFDRRAAQLPGMQLMRTTDEAPQAR